MNTQEVIAILYDEKIGEQIRGLLENICSPDKDSNNKAIKEMQQLVSDYTKYDWSAFIEWLYNTIPNFLTYFTEIWYMFNHCDWLKEIVIPKNIKKICQHSFGGCENLKQVSFEKDSELEELEPASFISCKNLETINLTNTKITILYDQLLWNNITTIKLPNTVTTLANGSLASYLLVEFSNKNLIDDLKLDIHINALTNSWYTIKEVSIGTFSDVDKITRESYKEPIVLGPKLAANKNIKIYW